MAKAKETVVVLPEVEFKVMRVRIVGETPLVTCPFSVKAMRQIEEKQQGKAKTGKHDIRNPWEDFINALYWLTPPPKEYTEEAFTEAVKNGARFGFHAGGIKNSAIMAAYRRGIVKNAVTARGMFQIINTETDMVYDKQCIEILTDEPPKEDDKREVAKTFVHVISDDKSRGYKLTDVAIHNENDREYVLKTAKRELLAFQEKYRQLTELALVFTAIAEVVKSGV